MTSTHASDMFDRRFQNLSDEELADIWYALAGAEIRHPDCFQALVAHAITALELRLGHGVKDFLDRRFAHLRSVDAVEDAAANRAAATGCEPTDRPQADGQRDRV